MTVESKKKKTPFSNKRNSPSEPDSGNESGVGEDRKEG